MEHCMFILRKIMNKGVGRCKFSSRLNLFQREERINIGISFSASLFSGAAKFDLTDTGRLDTGSLAVLLAGPLWWN